MSNGTTTVSPALFGASSAVVGLGAGYIFAPRKYSLKRLLTKDSDTFERTFSKEVMKDASSSEKASLNHLKTASDEYRTSGREILNEEIKPNVIQWKAMRDNVAVGAEFSSDLNAKKLDLQNAMKKNAFIDLRNSLKNLQEKASANPNDTVINQELKEASRKFSEAQKAMEIPINEYKKSLTSFKNARENAIKDIPDKGKSIAEQFSKVEAALKKRTNHMYKKLAEIASKDGIKNDYKAVKKFIPKARTYSAIMGGIILGIIGVLAGVFISNLQKK